MDNILAATTGATGTFVVVVNAPVINKKLVAKPIPVQVATDTIIYLMHTAKLWIRPYLVPPNSVIRCLT